MRIAIRNTTIVTADAGRTIHHDATLVIEDAGSLWKFRLLNTPVARTVSASSAPPPQ